MTELDSPRNCRPSAWRRAPIFNEARAVLLVKPAYRAGWLLPGGVVEAHESPAAACARELREELGLEIAVGRLLVVEYRSTAPPRTESLQFVFDGGVLAPEVVGRIALPAAELEGHGFFALDEAVGLLRGTSSQRLPWAWRALCEGRTIYAEDGVLRAG